MAKKFSSGYDGPMNERDKHPQRWYEFSALVAAELVSIGKVKGIRQKQIADAMGVSASQMSLYVSGKRGLMTTGHLLAACELLGAKPQAVVKAAHAKLTPATVDAGATGEVAPAPTVADDLATRRAAKDAEADRRLAEGRILAASEGDSYAELEDQPDPNGDEGA